MTDEELGKLKNSYRSRRYYQKNKNVEGFQEKVNNPLRIVKGKPLTEYQKEWRQRQQVLFEAYKAAQACKYCGETAACCLSFHHKGEVEKEINISAAIYTQHRSFKAVLPEIAKCEVVCENCHRKLHKGILVS